MSINGLRFSLERHSSAPLETKSGSCIYTGDASNFHDWSFRTLLRICLYEQQLEDRKPADPEGTSALPIPTEADEEPMTFPDLSGETTAQPPTPGSTPKAGASSKSPKKTKSSDGDRGPLVNKVIEGLRGDAFSIARDLGLEVLSAPGGLVRLVNEIKPMCSRVPSKKLRSCSVRDRNKEGLCLDSPVSQCCRMCRDHVDVGGLCCVSWMTRWSFQTACVQSWCWNWVDSTDKRSWWWRLVLTPKTLKELPKVLVENYSGIHLREGSRSWTSSSLGSQQARDTTTTKAKDMWRDLSHVLPTLPTPMKGRNIMSIGKNTKSIGKKSPLSVCSVMSPRKNRKIWIPTTIVNTMMMSMSMKQLRWMQCLNLTVQKMIDRLEKPYNSNLLPWLLLERQKVRVTPKARARARANLSVRTWPWAREIQTCRTEEQIEVREMWGDRPLGRGPRV